jgi:hypothetical protein
MTVQKSVQKLSRTAILTSSVDHQYVHGLVAFSTSSVNSFCPKETFKTKAPRTMVRPHEYTASHCNIRPGSMGTSTNAKTSHSEVEAINLMANTHIPLYRSLPNSKPEGVSDRLHAIIAKSRILQCLLYGVQDPISGQSMELNVAHPKSMVASDSVHTSIAKSRVLQCTMHGAQDTQSVPETNITHAGMKPLVNVTSAEDNQAAMQIMSTVRNSTTCVTKTPEVIRALKDNIETNASTEAAITLSTAATIVKPSAPTIEHRSRSTNAAPWIQTWNLTH